MDWEKLIKALEEQRKKEEAKKHFFYNWKEQIAAIADGIREKQKRMEAGYPIHSNWPEQVKYLVEYAELAAKERDVVVEKLDALNLSLVNYDENEVDRLLDELIVVLKKLKAM